MARQKAKQKLRSLEKIASKKVSIDQSQKFKNSRIPKSAILTAVVLVILLVGWLSGTISWGIKYAECGGAPVVIETGFEGSGQRFYPGEKEYSPGFFNHYDCMTPEEKSGSRY